MSGIYIRNAQMPVSCWDCEIGGAEQMDRDVCPFYRISWKEQDDYMHSRHSDCPCFPVPDHGRLIDGKALVQKICGDKWVDKVLTASIEELRTALINLPLVISNAPTIIPAEEVEP